MRIAIALMGTRGDVQPGISLALELQGRGHDVIVSVPRDLEWLALKTGLSAVVLDAEYADLMREKDSVDAVAKNNLFKTVRDWMGFLKDKANGLVLSFVEVSRGADLIIASQQTERICAVIGHVWSIPIVTLHFHPHRRNSFFAPPSLAPRWDMPKFAVTGFWISYDIIWGIIARLVWLPPLRASLGVRRIAAHKLWSFTKRGIPELQVYHGDLIPDLVQEWEGQRVFTGALRLPQSARSALGESVSPQSDLLEWLEAGSAPIFFGFGSIPHNKTEAEIIDIVTDVCAQSGQRGLVNFGSKKWEDLASLPCNSGGPVKVVGPIAHDFVFPRCRAAVVQGGIGTLTEAMLAGIPVLVCWVAFDQPYWGMAVKRLGVGDHIQFTEIEPAAFVEKILALLGPDVSKKAEELGGRLRDRQDGAAVAADFIEGNFVYKNTSGTKDDSARDEKI